ncbi:hypothetical protein [Natrarchaeobaculum sulfurireducens]|uniref:Uncharacterized protein n=1 Tax=Natrarchaeobaculum sulfurireducens TaxID=2044521 RepID=A0A346PHJ8_9EURY|nr:hypothetical protein [Natrarchaeobaculum sulfurireducens]AXR78993.1 hypothetical protein AArc1_2680 [Natrarchaeobaculum sulfurireducens]
MAGPLNTTNSVKAKVHNQVAFDEGEALEELEPGQGVVRGDGGFEAAGADSPTRRVVREQRNPGSRGIEDDESPLEKTYEPEANVETLGFGSHDQARLLISYADVDDDASDDTYGEGDEVGWNANGYLEVLDGDPTDAIGVIAQEDDVEMSDGDDPTHVLVEFY